jgi:hypothetical protein
MAVDGSAYRNMLLMPALYGAAGIFPANCSCAQMWGSKSMQVAAELLCINRVLYLFCPRFIPRKSHLM